MATLTGSSSEREEQAKKLTDSELVEIANSNDYPSALKAKAELQRRSTNYNNKILCWARAAGIAGILALIVAIPSCETLRHWVGSLSANETTSAILSVTRVVSNDDATVNETSFETRADCDSARVLVLQEAARAAAKLRRVEKENGLVISIPQVAAICR